MKEKLAPILEKVKAFLGGISRRTKILVGVGAGVALLVVAVLLVTMYSRPYAPLFTELTSGDLSAIVSFLDANGVKDYKIQNGDTVMVRQEQVNLWKGKLVAQGYPKSGSGYGTYLGNINALSTDADRRQLILYDLQDELAAVIRSMDGVKDATVKITEGENRSYILDVTNIIKASAAVIVTMKDGQKLSSQMAGSIRNFVSKSVTGLEMESVSIIDNMGNSYSGGATASGEIGEAYALKMALEEEQNNRIRTDVLSQLIPLYGEENLRVAVNTTVEMVRKVGEYTSYQTPEGAPAGQGIIGSEVYKNEIVRGAAGGVGGVVGTPANAELPNYVEEALGVDDNTEYAHQSGEKENKVNTNKEQVEYLAGNIADLTVVVTINSSTAGSVDERRLREHVATTAGLTADQVDAKISVWLQPFYNPDRPLPPGTALELPEWAIYAAIGGAALFLVLMVFILILRGRSRKKKAKKLVEAAALAFMPGVQEAKGANIMELRTEKSMELRKEIRQFAETNPEIAAQLVKTWLKGGEEN